MPSPQEYVRWVYENTRNWGMWQPHETISLGDVGYFTNDKIFTSTDFTTEELINFQPSLGPTHRVTNFVIGRTKDFRISGFGQGGVADIGSRLSVSIAKEKGFLVYVAEGYSQKLRNLQATLSSIRDGVISGSWRLDYALVGKRLVATEGFAAIFNEQGASLDFTTKAKVSANQSVPAALEAGVGFEGSSGEVNLFTFGGESTPTLGCTWRVRRELRDKLLGGKTSRTPKEDWVYAGSRADISKEEILRHPVDWLFEKEYTFDALP